MAEDQGARSESAEADTDSNPAAVALALGGASRATADAFLRDQQALIQDQRHYLQEQYKRLVEQVTETGLKLWELRLGVLLRIGTLVIALGVLGALAALSWNAAHAHGLVIESFSVPSDMAARGVTGEAVAAQILDRLTDLQTATDSNRPEQSFQNNWGDNIKVQIPETGISIGELRRFLYAWLGSDTHISGEVYRTATGIAVTARASGYGSRTFTGTEQELDSSLQKAAEFLYSQTQPYRYANYLDRNAAPQGREARIAEATAIYRELTQSPDPVERAWAWNGLGTQINAIHFDNRGAIPYQRKAVTTWPDFAIGYLALAFRERELGRSEQALADFRTAARLLAHETTASIDAAHLAAARNSAQTYIAALTGDFDASAQSSAAGIDIPNRSSIMPRSTFQWRMLQSLAEQHDNGAVRDALRSPQMQNLPTTVGQSLFLSGALGDWAAILAKEASIPKVIRFVSGPYPAVLAVVATAQGRAGALDQAQATIAATPADCDDCLIARANIAEWKGEHARADWWFARAAAQAPSLPFADTQWGQAMLARGKPDAAIPLLKRAIARSPRFADPREMWGEALMAQNRSDLALSKFQQAAAFAPNWGRLHLKWGEALVYAGKPSGAKAQFALAARLSLNAAERAELAKSYR